MKTAILCALCALAAFIATRTADRAMMAHPVIYVGSDCGAEPVALYADRTEAMDSCYSVDVHRLG